MQFKTRIKAEFKEIILKGLEERVDRLLAAREAAQIPARGWLRAVREATGLTQGQVAARIGITRQSYAQFETAEQRGSISVASLRRAAAAMDCDLICYLVPRTEVASGFAALARMRDPQTQHLSATEHSMRLGKDPEPDAATP